MTTIIYLKNKPADIIPIDVMLEAHYELIKLEFITLRCSMLNPMFWWVTKEYKQAPNHNRIFWFGKAINPLSCKMGNRHLRGTLSSTASELRLF